LEGEPEQKNAKCQKWNKFATFVEKCKVRRRFHSINGLLILIRLSVILIIIIIVLDGYGGHVQSGS